ATMKAASSAGCSSWLNMVCPRAWVYVPLRCPTSVACSNNTSGLLQGTQQRVLMGTRVIIDLCILGFRDLARVGPRDTLATCVHGEHDLHGLFVRDTEIMQQHFDDEFHGRVIVVVQDHAIQWRPARFRARLFDHDAGTTLLVCIAGARLVARQDGRRRTRGACSATGTVRCRCPHLPCR